MMIVGKPESVRDVHVDWRLDYFTVVSFPKSVSRCDANNSIQRIFNRECYCFVCER